MGTRTIRCKLAMSQEIDAALSETREAFAKACNAILETALATATKDAIKLHHLMYRSVRERFSLGANLTVRAIRRVAGALAQKKKKRAKPTGFRPGSIEYDARLFSLREKDWTVSLNTLRGRKRIQLEIGDYQRNALLGKKPTSATLVHRKGVWHLNIVIEEEDPPKVEGPPMGVDLGIRNIAYTSTRFCAEGHTRRELKETRMQIRASLQSKGTKGAKKLLKRLSGYEKRRIRHENHILSKQLIEEAKRHNIGVIRLEQLQGIRDRGRIWSRHLNRMISGWSFYELQQFVAYKASRMGIAIEYVNPSYTSQTCCNCGRAGERKEDVFRCIACGERHADYNAACVIARGGADVSRPELAMCS